VVENHHPRVKTTEKMNPGLNRKAAIPGQLTDLI
jgi:hypothetical protein